MKKFALSVNYSLFVLLCLTGLVAAQATRYTVQLEAAPAFDAAQEKVKELRLQGLEAYIVRTAVQGKGIFYRVRVGNFPNQADARKYGADLQNKGVVREFFIAPYEAPQKDLPPIVTTIASAPVKPVSSPPSNSPPASTATAKDPSKDPSKEDAKEQPSSKPVVKEPQVAAKSEPSTTAKNPGPGPNQVASLTPTSTPPVNPAAINFVRFQDQAIGYSFDRPQYWEGGQLGAKDAQDQKVNAGALFQSYQDSAFITAIWNNLDKANSPDNDNDLIVELILKSMGSGDGTQQMTEASRKVVSESGVIKTFLDLRATFKGQGQDGPLDFLGKAVIVRANKGILLVVAFYSKTGPPHVAGVADRIIASVRPPE